MNREKNRQTDGEQNQLQNRLYYDLHIHSCLSPCGDNDMTPANIAAMAMLKGLDVIAVTDHNSCKNCPAVIEECKKYGIMAIPGMELSTSEEVHCICLFPDLGQAMDFDSYVYGCLIKTKNREEIFGEQLIYNEKDQIVGREPNLLIQSARISFDEADALVKQYGGLMFPAHIDRKSFSLLSNLGFISPDSTFRCAELFDVSREEALKQAHPYLETCRILCNSDAHFLEHIHEAEYSFHCESRSREEILACLKRERC